MTSSIPRKGLGCHQVVDGNMDNEYSHQMSHKINAVMNRVMLNRMGVLRNIRLVVIYSPLHMGGTNYPCFAVIQDQKDILYLLQEL